MKDHFFLPTDIIPAALQHPPLLPPASFFIFSCKDRILSIFLFLFFSFGVGMNSHYFSSLSIFTLSWINPIEVAVLWTLLFVTFLHPSQYFEMVSWGFGLETLPKIHNPVTFLILYYLVNFQRFTVLVHFPILASAHCVCIADLYLILFGCAAPLSDCS